MGREPMLCLRDADVRAAARLGGRDGSGEQQEVEGAEEAEAEEEAAAEAAPPVLLRSVDLEVSRGECVLVVGPNGAGKTSLLRALGGGDGSLAAGEREMADGVRIFEFGQDSAEKLVGEQTAAEALIESSGWMEEEAIEARAARAARAARVARAANADAALGDGNEKAEEAEEAEEDERGCLRSCARSVSTACTV